ncbi:tetraacyldisaccharide 4'-kinase [Blastochloris viridis]|uniref:Tetraacyldisaccharide 4'-kinase n=1 Tax=Blastochloris viridis TaxID=1079 RepID=A0A0H5B7M1_BLAVI|nr:tetraacyldisaccharide 4'-kinase [Blastochloris viridis]ALK08540.1 Tetraacyldisaccharide 4'-kinase [Blastochloris viridis]BAR98172.1 tetraacyldisaccharide 4'-kinase [Blastochloris viridis]CUU41203.1 Tetraacyldisaccharide 4'-kinase [Blastochloris viridis]
MRAPALWWRKPGIAAAMLGPAAWLYGSIAERRLAHAGQRAARPVVCVGNPTLGGAGKTPTAIALAALLAELGDEPVFLSRGYGGRIAGPRVVDPGRDTAAEVGDEPLLLARAAPTVVARDRPAGAALAASLGSVVVMDDGFQNPSLIKDLSLLVVDAAVGLGNGRVFPAGPLRAPLRPQLDRADAMVLVGDGPSIDAAPLPVLRARLEPDAAPLEGLGPILAFAGIGRPQKFADTLAALGRPPARFVAFPDHHRYSAADASALLDHAARENLALVTTEKDRVRLAGDPALETLAQTCRTLPVRLVFEDEPRVRGLLAEALRR